MADSTAELLVGVMAGSKAVQMVVCSAVRTADQMADTRAELLVDAMVGSKAVQMVVCLAALTVGSMAVS